MVFGIDGFGLSDLRYTFTVMLHGLLVRDLGYRGFGLQARA